MTNKTTSAIDPTQWGDEVAEEMRAYYEANRSQKWVEGTADNLMLGLLNIALRSQSDTITRLQAALTYIGKTRYGLDTNASDEEASEYWSKLALDYRRKALEALSSVGGE